MKVKEVAAKDQISKVKYETEIRLTCNRERFESNISVTEAIQKVWEYYKYVT